jgi:hypothetical protein
MNGAAGVAVVVRVAVDVIVGVSVGGGVTVGVYVRVGVGVSVANMVLSGWEGPVSQMTSSAIPATTSRPAAPYTKMTLLCCLRRRYDAITSLVEPLFSIGDLLTPAVCPEAHKDST